MLDGTVVGVLVRGSRPARPPAERRCERATVASESTRSAPSPVSAGLVELRAGAEAANAGRGRSGTRTSIAVAPARARSREHAVERDPLRVRQRGVAEVDLQPVAHRDGDPVGPVKTRSRELRQRRGRRAGDRERRRSPGRHGARGSRKVLPRRSAARRSAARAEHHAVAGDGGHVPLTSTMATGGCSTTSIGRPCGNSAGSAARRTTLKPGDGGEQRLVVDGERAHFPGARFERRSIARASAPCTPMMRTCSTAESGDGDEHVGTGSSGSERDGQQRRRRPRDAPAPGPIARGAAPAAATRQPPRGTPGRRARGGAAVEPSGSGDSRGHGAVHYRGLRPARPTPTVRSRGSGRARASAPPARAPRRSARAPGGGPAPSPPARRPCSPPVFSMKFACLGENRAPPTVRPLQPACASSRPGAAPLGAGVLRVLERRAEGLDPLRLGLVAPAAHSPASARRPRGVLVSSELQRAPDTTSPSRRVECGRRCRAARGRAARRRRPSRSSTHCSVRASSPP